MGKVNSIYYVDPIDIFLNLSSPQNQPTEKGLWSGNFIDKFSQQAAGVGSWRKQNRRAGYHLIDFTVEIGAQCSGDPKRNHVELTPSETSVEASSGIHRICGGFGFTPPTKASRNLFVDEESCLQFLKNTTPVQPNKAKRNKMRYCCSFSWLSLPIGQRSLQSVMSLPFQMCACPAFY